MPKPASLDPKLCWAPAQIRILGAALALLLQRVPRGVEGGEGPAVFCLTTEELAAIRILDPGKRPDRAEKRQTQRRLLALTGKVVPEP